MSGKNVVKSTSVLLLALWSSCSGINAQSLPPLPNPWNNQIGNWSFEDTNWFSDYGYAPISFTNLDNQAGFDGNALQVDSTNAAWLQYNIIEDDDFENLTFDQGTIELWVLPNWNSATNGGTGPGDWGRLIDVGAYGTNAPSSWWSMYFTPDGNNLCFSSETNGVFTNYLNVPISWDSNTWHLVSLTYDQSQSQLYIDGQLATNGAGVQYLPSASVVSNGFFVGSDHTGTNQSHAQIDDLSTYNYVIWSAEITNDYAAGMNLISPSDSGGLMSGGFGGGGFGMDDSSDSSTDSITNLWIAQLSLASGHLTAIASNTLPGVQYEIQSLNDLRQTNWQSQGFILGSEMTNWTPLNPLAVDYTTNCFFRLRSWIDSYNVGIPDWWQLLYFGYIGIDPNAPDPSGDGYSNIQKYQMGLNPNTFTPPAVNNFIAVLSTNGTNVILEWNSSPGSVQSYSLGRYDFDYDTDNFYFTSLGQMNSNAVSFVDTNDSLVISGDYWDTYYQIQANYTNGSTPVAYAWWFQFSPSVPSGIITSYNANNSTASVNWQPSPGDVTGYTILRQNSTTSGFSPITTVSASQTSYTDSSYPGGYDVQYEVEANYAEGSSSPSAGENPRVTAEYTVPAHIIRGTNGSLFLTAAGVPPGVTAFRVYRTDSQTAYYPISSYSDGSSYTNSIYTGNETELFSSGVGNGYFDVPVTNFVNGVYLLSSNQAPIYGTFTFQIQAIGSGGMAGEIVTNGNATGDSGRADYNIPFYDGRTQIAQNIIFLLRDTQPNAPFELFKTSAYGEYYNYSGNSAYVFAGFHFFNNNNASPLVMNEFQPFEENNYYKNYCYSSANVDTNGNINTGIGDDPAASGPAWHWAYFTFSPTTYYFDTYGYVSSTALPSFSTVLDSTTTQWQLFDNAGWVSLFYGVNHSIPNLTNEYGLSLISIKWPGFNKPPTFPTLSPGSAATNSSGSWFFQYDQPTLNSNSYYFGRHHIDPLPGESSFTVTNTTPVIITSVGQPFNITAWAKQSLANGYSGKYAYAEQYFDKAYTADTNGNATTNQTGILSEYGEFFPTKPGQVILTTKPDGDLGTVGQCTVNVIGLSYDANHDGTIDTGFAGSDATSASNPYTFWCNNNYDRLATNTGLWGALFTDVEQDDQPIAFCPVAPRTPTPDCNYSNILADGYAYRAIPCTRDLEDFARLWVCGVTTNLLSALPAGDTITLSWGDVGNPNFSNPTIDLFAAADTNGGIGYLTNETVAAQQTNVISYPYIGRLAPGGSIQLNSTNFNGWAGNYFIWCGVNNGNGGLVLTIANSNGIPLAQTTGYIQIVDIKQMYERWTVGDVTTQPPATIAQLAEDLPSDMAQSFQYGPATANTPYILSVHGFNMPTWTKDRFAETEYKRLYWQGYQGRFGEFRWPTTIQNFAAGARAFDDSESNAWASATGLLNLLTDLNAEYPGNVYLTAHSHGNVVAGEALRLAKTNQVVNTYIAMQAAISAHCYDPSTANRWTVGPPDRYAQYYTNGAPCYFNGSAGAGTYVNFYNTNDWALATLWQPDQDLKPDSGYQYSTGLDQFLRDVGLGSVSLYFPTNTYEIFAYADPARSFALGEQANVGGAFLTGTNDNQVSLPDVWPPDTSIPPYSAHVWHSAEFRSDNPQRCQFWNEALIEMKLK